MISFVHFTRKHEHSDVVEIVPVTRPQSTATDNMYTNVEDSAEAGATKCNGRVNCKPNNTKAALAASADEEYEEMMVQKETKDVKRELKVENKDVNEDLKNENAESNDNRLYAKVNKPRHAKSADPSHKRLGVKVFDMQNAKNNLREIIHNYNQNSRNDINYSNVVHTDRKGAREMSYKQNSKMNEKSTAMRATDDEVMMYENREIYTSQDESE